MTALAVAFVDISGEAKVLGSERRQFDLGAMKKQIEFARPMRSVPRGHDHSGLENIHAAHY